LRHDLPHARATLGFVLSLALSALVLSSCASQHHQSVTGEPRVTGTPARSISVPLSSVGCTRNDACIAVGTSSVNTSPDAVAEFATPKGNWLTL